MLDREWARAYVQRECVSACGNVGTWVPLKGDFLAVQDREMKWAAII